MKKKLIVSGMAAVLMALGLVFAACSNPSGGGGGDSTPTPTGGSGKLTITGAPGSGSVVILDVAEPTTLMQATLAMSTMSIAVGTADNATTYKLSPSTGGTVFNRSGNFLVVFSYNGKNYQKKVAFTGGIGTVVFSSMKDQSTLPIN